MLDVLRHHKIRFIPVVSYGRSGSSYFMALLRACGVTVRGNLPYEDRSLQVAGIRWLGATFGSVHYNNPRHAFHLGIHYIGSLFDGAEGEEQCRARVEEYCSKAGTNGIIAEKAIGNILIANLRANDHADLIQPVYLVRDPRDIFLSIKAFDAKRQSSGFGDRGDDPQLFRAICEFSLGQQEQFMRHGGLLLHYEDLMADRQRSLVEVFRLLGRDAVRATDIAAALAIAKRSDDNVRAHRTIADASDGIGRWRTEEGVPYRTVFNGQERALFDLGYAG